MSKAPVPAMLQREVDRWADAWLTAKFSRLLELRAQDSGPFTRTPCFSRVMTDPIGFPRSSEIRRWWQPQRTTAQLFKQQLQWQAPEKRRRAATGDHQPLPCGVDVRRGHCHEQRHQAVGRSGQRLRNQQADGAEELEHTGCRHQQRRCGQNRRHHPDQVRLRARMEECDTAVKTNMAARPMRSESVHESA